jgi:hypothetical protein
MTKQITRKQMEDQVFRMTGRRHKIPPRDSELWPMTCRGAQWDWGIAMLYVGRCQMCAYACEPSKGRQSIDKNFWLQRFLLCTNHPDSPGRLRDVLPTEMCRNFTRKRYLPSRSKKPKDEADRRTYPSDDRVRWIPLGDGRFAIVDAADYERLSKHKWCVSNKQGMGYVMRRTKAGRTAYMHREVTGAPKGKVVDHVNHNTMNNRRCNVRVCTDRQNQANKGPHGGSTGYVGVYPRDGRYEAGITWRGKHYYLGRFDDPIEAARARDRKARELLGPYAYLNFPEDFGR